MASNRSKLLVLALLTVVLAVAVYRAWPVTGEVSATAPGPAGVSGTRPPAPPVAGFDVRLEALEAKRPELGPVNRNLFEFERRAAPAAAAVVVPRGVPEPAAVQIVPRPEPIPLKFIGL